MGIEHIRLLRQILNQMVDNTKKRSIFIGEYFFFQFKLLSTASALLPYICTLTGWQNCSLLWNIFLLLSLFYHNIPISSLREHDFPTLPPVLSCSHPNERQSTQSKGQYPPPAHPHAV